MPNGLDIDQENSNSFQWVLGSFFQQDDWHEWDVSQGAVSCRLQTASGRLYTQDEILVHVAECGEAQSLLADLAVLDQLVPATDKLPKQKRKPKPRWYVNHYRY